MHGADVITVNETWLPGRWPARADAMVTDRPGIALGIVITADCAPILFADARTGVVGACPRGVAECGRGRHRGHRLERAAMVRSGAQLSSITAAVGPCIGQASYEVGADLRDAVLARDPAHDAFFGGGRREARWSSSTCPATVRPVSPRPAYRRCTGWTADTAADEARFFSHRRRTLGGGGPIGHQISIITLD